MRTDYILPALGGWSRVPAAFHHCGGGAADRGLRRGAHAGAPVGEPAGGGRLRAAGPRRLLRRARSRVALADPFAAVLRDRGRHPGGRAGRLGDRAAGAARRLRRPGGAAPADPPGDAESPRRVRGGRGPEGAGCRPGGGGGDRRGRPGARRAAVGRTLRRLLGVPRRESGAGGVGPVGAGARDRRGVGDVDRPAGVPGRGRAGRRGRGGAVRSIHAAGVVGPRLGRGARRARARGAALGAGRRVGRAGLDRRGPPAAPRRPNPPHPPLTLLLVPKAAPFPPLLVPKAGAGLALWTTRVAHRVVTEAAPVPVSSRGPHGVFLGSHAVVEGAVSRSQLQSGLYRRLMHNVYADPRLVADHRLFARGALLLMPDDAALGGRTAAAWYGAAFAGATETVLAVAPPGTSWRGCRGIRVHRRPLPAQDISELEDDGGIVRLTTPVRTAW